MEKILDFLQTIYPVRLDPKDIPSSLRGPLDKAVKRFENSGALEKLDMSKMGICEEAADLTYQVLKFISLREKILTEETIRTLQDYLERNGHYDSEERLVGFDYRKLDELSISLVPDKLVRELRCRLPDVLFAPNRDNGSTIIRDFLGGQFVAYISRIWRGHAMGGLQAVEHMRDKKIPEEAEELAAAAPAYRQELMQCVSVLREKGETNTLFILLAKILSKEMPKSVTVEDTLHLMFLKMKGRQELDFMGVPEQTMRYICKPVEYLIEADMFF